MIKKFLSATLFGFLMLGLAGTFVACDDYDDSDLRRRVDAVEGTLADLKAQIANGVLIESITSSSNGVTITTSDGNTYNITNGTNGVDGTPGSVVEIGDNGNWFIDGVDTGMPSRGAAGQDGADGQDGQDGKDGYVPSIEIRDGYWYIDGQNTGQAAQGPAGADGQDGADGEDGKDGQDGADGADGTVITISEDGYWVIDGVKTDVIARGQNGADGQDGTDGEDGKDGEDGEDGKDANLVYYVPDMKTGCWAKVVYTNDGETQISYTVQDGTNGTERLPWLPEGTITAVLDTDTQILTLCNVKVKDSETGETTTVTIKLSEPLVGMTFVPDAIDNGLGVVTHYELKKKGKIIAASNELNLVYRLNPSNADLTGIDFDFVGRKVAETRAKNDLSTLLTYKSHTVSAGELNVVANVGEIPAGYNPSSEALIFALRANDDENNRVITSDNAKIDYNSASNYAIYDNGVKKAYETDFDKIDVTTTPADVTIAIGTTVDLNEWVKTIGTDCNNLVVDNYFDVVYTFSNGFTVDGGDGTNQNSFISIDENGVVSITAGASAINRKPVVKVDASVNGTVLASAYIVMQITQSSMETVTITANNINVEYPTLPGAGEAEETPRSAFNWEQINRQLYDVVGLSAVQFAASYSATANVEVTGAEVANLVEVDGDLSGNISIDLANQVPGITVNLAKSFPGNALETESFITIQFDDQVPVSNEASHTCFGEITITYKPLVGDAYPDVVLIIPYTVNDDCADMKLDYSDVVVNENWNINGYLPAMASAYTDYVFGAVLNQAYISDLSQAGVKNHTYKFAFADAPVSTATTYKEAELTGSDWTDQEIEFTSTIGATGVTTSYTLELLSTRDNGETDRVADTFTINFISPLAMEPDESRLVTSFNAQGNLKALNVKRGVKIVDLKTGADVVRFGGNAVANNNYKLTTNDIAWSFDMVEDYGDMINVDANGNLVLGTTGWSLTLPATIHVKVTATIDGIVVLTKTVEVTINQYGN